MRKRILIITSEFPPQPGGIGNHAYNLAKNLAREGYEITVITDDRSDDGIEEINFDKGLDFDVVRIRKRMNRYIMYLHRLHKFRSLKRNKDAIIASGKFSLWAVALLRESSTTKYLAVIHGTEVNLSQPLSRRFVNYSLSRFNKLIAVSSYTKQLIDPRFRTKAVVIPNGYDSDIWISENLLIKKNPNLKPVLTTVGNVNYRKGQQNVIKNLPDLLKRYPNLEYHIIGLPSFKDDFMQLAESLDVKSHVVFHGVVPQEQMVSLVESADIFVMLSTPSNSGDVEGFGIAVIEANSLGLPAIGAKNCGIEDAIDPNKSGILIDYNDTKGFCDAVGVILEDYKEFSHNANTWAKKHSWNNIVTKYIYELEK